MVVGVFFFVGGYGDVQLVFWWCQWVGCEWCECVWWVVGVIEIEYYVIGLFYVVGGQCGVEEVCCVVGFFV